MGTTYMTRPDGTQVCVESCDDVLVHAADAAGTYLGLMPDSSAPQRVPHAPPDVRPWWCWMGGAWMLQPPLAARVAEALTQIDAAAGSVRLRYITDVPGQQGTYLLKEQQASAYLMALATDPEAAVPPFVAAEAEALGATAAVAAQGIVATAALWADQLAPAIECERRRGKLACEAAADEAALQAVLTQALAALAAVGAASP